MGWKWGFAVVAVTIFVYTDDDSVIINLFGVSQRNIQLYRIHFLKGEMEVRKNRRKMGLKYQYSPPVGS